MINSSGFRVLRKNYDLVDNLQGLTNETQGLDDKLIRKIPWLGFRMLSSKMIRVKCSDDLTPWFR